MKEITETKYAHILESLTVTEVVDTGRTYHLKGEHPVLGPVILFQCATSGRYALIKQ